MIVFVLPESKTYILDPGVMIRPLVHGQVLHIYVIGIIITFLIHNDDGFIKAMKNKDINLFLITKLITCTLTISTSEILN